MKRIRKWLRSWWECRTKRCSYFKHYLAYGPPDLTHEGFHAAEEHCAYWQERQLAWFRQHENDNAQEPAELARMCEMWEKRIRA